MLEDIKKKQRQSLAGFLRGRRRLIPLRIRIFFAAKLSRQKPSLMVAIGKRRKVNALEEYRRRFASPAELANQPSSLPSPVAPSFLGKAPAQPEPTLAKRPERSETAKQHHFKIRGRWRRNKRLKAKSNWSGGGSRHFSGGSRTVLLMALLRGYHRAASIRRSELIAVIMACAIALGATYVYRAAMVDEDDSFHTSHIVQPPERAEVPSSGNKLTYERLTAEGEETATASQAASSVSAPLAGPPSAGLDNRMDGPLPEGKASGDAPATVQPVAAAPLISSRLTVLRSERYLPDGTRVDVQRPAPIPSVVRLGAGQIRPPYLAAAQPSVATAGVTASETNIAPAAAMPPAQPAVEPASPPESGYFAQVKSDQDRKAAEAELAAVAEKYKAVLGGVPLTTRAADLKEKGIWFRVLAGPVKSRDEAESLCRKLKSAGIQACIVQKFD